MSEKILSPYWAAIVAKLDFAFQPIVNIHNGATYGFEALLRGHDVLGFSSIHLVFDMAWASGELPIIDRMLRRMALDKFRLSKLDRCARVFYNLDNRLLDSNVPAGNDRIDDPGVTDMLILEVSERHPVSDPDTASTRLREMRKSGLRIALDDFGAGYSGMQMLYHAEPDIVKIDRFFITDIDTCIRKQLFVNNLVTMAHQLGMLIIAEGVETEREYLQCRALGCDMLQGYFVQKPTREIEQMFDRYPHIDAVARSDRRRMHDDGHILKEHIQRVEPIRDMLDVDALLQRFRCDPELDFIPVVDIYGEPRGAVREKDLKDYVYSPFGISLLRKLLVENASSIVKVMPVADSSQRIGKLLEYCAASQNPDGIILTRNGVYQGILTARSMLRILNEKELVDAREQNPLTRLPGNLRIAEYIASPTVDAGNRVFVYFDFDNFKPFNDAYGFRKGDLVILLFADILRDAALRFGAFVGHVGGDDFFAGFSIGTGKGPHTAEVVAIVKDMVARFAENARSFYSAADRAAGGITMQNREGVERSYPCITVSAAVLEIPPTASLLTAEELVAMIAHLKTDAKNSPDHIAAMRLSAVPGLLAFEESPHHSGVNGKKSRESENVNELTFEMAGPKKLCCLGNE